MMDSSTNSPVSATGLTGLRVCSFESRRGEEMRSLIERQGAIATIAPSMREIPIEENVEALTFGARLLAGEVDMMVFLTGVGARGLAEVLEKRWSLAEIVAALNKTTIVVRGPKPAVVMRDWGVRIDIQVPEPNTWRDLLAAIDVKSSIQNMRVAVQEYGQSNLQLLEGLRDRGASVSAVPVYRWSLPDDTGPLEAAITATIAGDFDALLFTSAQQAHHVLQLAERNGVRESWLASARRTAIGSIGPTATETLVALGLTPDFEPEHPKMGHLVLAANRLARAALISKRGDE